jgi:hypothetical protein
MGSASTCAHGATLYTTTVGSDLAPTGQKLRMYNTNNKKGTFSKDIAECDVRQTRLQGVNVNLEGGREKAKCHGLVTAPAKWQSLIYSIISKSTHLLNNFFNPNSCNLAPVNALCALLESKTSPTHSRHFTNVASTDSN